MVHLGHFVSYIVVNKDRYMHVWGACIYAYTKHSLIMKNLTTIKEKKSISIIYDLIALNFVAVSIIFLTDSSHKL